MPEVGEVAERSNATDCKSVALVASEVRILPSPPAFARRSWAKDSYTQWRRATTEVKPTSGAGSP